MTIDNRTPALNLPLPDPGNALNEDVLRLVAALQAIDAAIAGKTNAADIAAAVATRATPADIANAIANLIGGAPETLNTLNEIAQALNNNPNFAAWVSGQLALKANANQVVSSINGVAGDVVGFTKDEDFLVVKRQLKSLRLSILLGI